MGRFLTVAETAVLLGVSEATVRRMIADNRLDAYKMGPKATRLLAADVWKFIRDSKTVTVE